MKDKKNYDISADIIRIIAAFLVVLSHATDRFVIYDGLKHSLSWNIVYYISTFSRVAVPLFIMLSGYFLLNKEKVQDVKVFYRNRFTRILFPFIFWTAVYTGFDINWNIVKLTGGYIWERISDGGGLWHLYFLVVILELYLLAPFFVRLIEKLKNKGKTILFWSLLGFSVFCSLININGIDFKRYSLTMFIPYIGIFYAGAYLKTVNIRNMLVFPFFILLFILPGITNMIGGGVLGNFIVLNYSPTILSMAIILFLFMKNITKYFKTFIDKVNVKNTIRLFASTTFGIFLIHALVLDKVFSYFHLLPWEIHAPLVFYACLPGIITFIVSFIMIAAIKRIPYGKYLVG